MTSVNVPNVSILRARATLILPISYGLPPDCLVLDGFREEAQLVGPVPRGLGLGREY
jgi:hypothetical protein